MHCKNSGTTCWDLILKCLLIIHPLSTILYTGVRPTGSSVNFTFSALICHISLWTSLTASICSMPDHDSVAISSRCVVSLTLEMKLVLLFA